MLKAIFGRNRNSVDRMQIIERKDKIVVDKFASQKAAQEMQELRDALGDDYLEAEEVMRQQRALIDAVQTQSFW